MSQEPMPAPDVEWVKVSGPEALAPLDRHWIRYLRVVLLAAAVLIAWRILAWQEDAYQLAAAAAAPSAQVVVPEAVTAPPIPETPAATATVSVVVISPTPTPTPPATPTPTPAPTPTPKTHRVRLGDTLSEIADFYGVTMDEILSLNNIPDPDNLHRSGRCSSCRRRRKWTPRLTLPATYIVRPGETLSDIAVKLGMTIEQLTAANDIADPDSIFAGQELNVPGGGT